MSNGTTSDIQKKVAFLSPPPTPGPALGSLPENESSTGPSGAHAKSTVSRFQATHAKDTRGSTSTAASSKTDVASTARSARQASTRTAPSPFTAKSYNDGASIHQSLRSGTPYSQTSNASSRILLAQSWSEVAEEDLVSNIGQRERTRQEVLWEIVASEERYVNELLKLKETFIDPLLHPYSATSPIASPTPLDYEDYPRSDTPGNHSSTSPLQLGSSHHSDDGHPTIDGESMNSEEEGEADDRMGATYASRGKNASGMSQAAKHNHPQSPYNSRTTGVQAQSEWGTGNRGQRRCTCARIAGGPSKCLEVIEGGILDGHMKLSESLRKRYEEQYPLVRSLADVFVSNVDNAMSTASASKKPKKQDADQWVKVCQCLQRLEVISSDKGETGLAISLSKPFQRLLKYPLLFQNLLYHTDPSTFEYESTLGMVAEVEMIVRSIEDEKIQKEERDKTRDVFARIEGLDKVKQLMVPKPSRVLMEERVVGGLKPGTDATIKLSAPPPTTAKGVKGKTSFRRLSDVLQPGSGGVGGKKDQWLVVFNDVVLRCQRTGTTSLPLGASTNSRTTSLPEFQGKAKYATTGRRNVHTKPRNLYKFLKIETWAIGDVVQPREGVVSMEDTLGVQPRLVPMPDDDEDAANDSDDSDRKSKMSFSYWGADKVTVQKPIKPRQLAANIARRGAAGSPTAYGRESSANAKFGTRLISADSPSGGARPASRRTQVTPSGGRRQPHSDEDHTVRATVTKATVTGHRPAWDGSTRAPATTPTQKRPRNTSQTSAATRTTTTATAPKQLSSPAPSEDSGVGFYRQIIAQNPSLNALNA
ncbi:uncharacterized protein B0H18DRAFT_951242 [Fomitopsis serialis]|uniref:uncharacterized protein n=1 Tax=Fomitopsis serialis TaxID=139415 RepID=UPI00200884B1|nr:uncharacterized protein B0H18DRAFT_951242 [Neoantrodia serialis]KAH9934622.1 hypothetical protein B0H18DRAFT_951242 [Neoantrodia serialis]